MIGRAAAYTDAPIANNATFQLDFPFDWHQDILRLDFRPSNNHGFYLRYLHDDYDLIEPRGTFIGAPLPTISTNRVRPGFGYQVAHSWMISQNLVNEVKLNVSGNGQRIPPVGDSGCATPTASSSRRCSRAAATTTASPTSRSPAPARRSR